jgi:hypothetical protein
MSKRIKIAEAADEMGFEKVGKYYYDSLYLTMLEYNDDCRLGAPCYDSEGDYHNNKRYTGKEVVQAYKEWLAIVQEETL